MASFGSLTVDPDAQAAYLYLSASKVARTAVMVDGVNIDLDSSGSVVGVEILFSAMESILETANILNDPSTVEAIREGEAS